jgi:hypothetical protein
MPALRIAVVKRAPLALGLAVALVAACTRVDLPVSATTPPPAAVDEDRAWAMVRSTLPGVPILLPTWLPASIHRDRVEVRMGHCPSGDPLYTLTYRAPDGAGIAFALGPATDIPGSGIGTRVRNSPAVLSFPSSLSDPAQRAPRQIRWQEGRHVLRIETDRFTGEDLLHIAWSLDRTGEPAPKNPYTRVKPGVCAARGASPEDTVRRLLALVGSGDRDAVADCSSLELLGEDPGYSDWADLPRASGIVLHAPRQIAGRVAIGADWTFVSDPGGAWGRRAFQIFVLGQEDGAWRVYETATALGLPPP